SDQFELPLENAPDRRFENLTQMKKVFFNKKSKNPKPICNCSNCCITWRPVPPGSAGFATVSCFPCSA
ncbi:MAG: hypothetical protein KDA89_19955, partial [Planctomycetaceae bacterium]|nr:hypothetical protein [Planctomycetaceae bacterium]